MDKRNNQVFVRNLAFDTTNEDLMTLFQDIGPVKRASVAVDNGVVKGYGFVKFVMEEDAAKAVALLHNHPFKGRNIQLEIAVRKGQNPMKSEFVEGSEHNSKVSKPPAQPRSSISVALEAKIDASVAAKAVPNATTEENSNNPKKDTSSKPRKSAESSIAVSTTAKKAETSSISVGAASLSRARRLMLWGLPSTAHKKDVVKAVSKFCRKCEVSIVTEHDALYEAVAPLTPVGKMALISVPSKKFVDKIVSGFNGKSSKLFFKPPTDLVASADQTPSAVVGVSTLVIRSLAEITEPELRRRKCRVILRNLSFQAIDQNVADKLSRFGPLTEVFLPRVEITITPQAGKKPRRKHGRSDDPEVDADTPIVKSKPRGFAFVTFLCEKDATAAVSSSAGLRVCNREVAIDFCSSKEIYARSLAEASSKGTGLSNEEETAGAEISPNVAASATAALAQLQRNEGEEGAENDDESDTEDENSEEGSRLDNSIDSDIDEGASESENEDNEKRPKSSSEGVDPDVEEGRTVFIRDLSFDCTQEEIRSVLSQFGKILFVALVKEKDTGICKGTAFVKFKTQAEAIACVQATRDSRPPLTIMDRPFRADIAVDKSAAERLKAGAVSSTRKDKRNLYLANEGLLVENDSTSSKSLMTPEERDKRQRAQQEKKKKLVNPLFFVSATRLSIRNLPKAVGDNDLKIMCLRAVKAGLAKKLVGPSDVAAQLIAQGEDLKAQQASALVMPSHTVRQCIKSAKVMLDLKKLRNGVPQSRSYGFVEFTHHIHALACLRELNHSLEYVKLLPEVVQHSMLAAAAESRPQRLMVEFSLENFNKVQLLKKREEAVQRKKAGVSDANVSEDVNEDDEQENSEASLPFRNGLSNKRGREQLVVQGEDHDSADDDDNDEADTEDEREEKTRKHGGQNKKPRQNEKPGAAVTGKKRAANTTTTGGSEQPNKKPKKGLSKKSDATNAAAKPNPGSVARAALVNETAEDAQARKLAKQAKRKAAEAKRANKIAKRQAKKLQQATEK